MDRSELNAVARVVAAKILIAFPEWESAIRAHGPADDPSARSGDLAIAVTPPAQPAHCLEVVLRGNSVEVRYDDSQPPGPAEQVFVDVDRAPAQASDAVVTFLRDLTAGRVVVARRSPGRLVRLLWPGRSHSQATFCSAREIASADAERYAAVYKWTD